METPGIYHGFIIRIICLPQRKLCVGEHLYLFNSRKRPLVNMAAWFQVHVLIKKSHKLCTVTCRINKCRFGLTLTQVIWVIIFVLTWHLVIDVSSLLSSSSRSCLSHFISCLLCSHIYEPQNKSSRGRYLETFRLVLQL